MREHRNGSYPPVIGYVVLRGLGVREVDHSIMSLEEAKRMRKRDSDFRYYTAREFVARLQEVQRGGYVLNDDGLILGLNPAYTE